MKIKLALMTIFLVAIVALAGCGSKTNTTPVSATSDTTATDQSGTEDNNPVAAVPPASGADTTTANQPPRSITTLASLPDVIASDSIDITGKTRPGYKVFIDGQEAFPNVNGEFSLKYSLQVGKNQIEVVTLGKEKIEETKTIAIERRPPPPMLTVVPPDSSDSEYLTISGKTEKGCIVYVNSTPASPDREGNFSSTVQLNEGSNKIKITSTNSDGGTAVVENTVTFNPPNPRLEVVIPDTASSKQVIVSGITDNNTVLVLYVNDVRSTIDQQNGIFSSAITLEDGINMVKITAINKWGKKTTVNGSIFCNSSSSSS